MAAAGVGVVAFHIEVGEEVIGRVARHVDELAELRAVRVARTRLREPRGVARFSTEPFMQGATRRCDQSVRRGEIRGRNAARSPLPWPPGLAPWGSAVALRGVRG